MLAQKLNMESDDAERWIVNLIRNAKLDAKIDSQLGHVVMGTQTTSPLEQVNATAHTCKLFSQSHQIIYKFSIWYHVLLTFSVD